MQMQPGFACCFHFLFLFLSAACGGQVHGASSDRPIDAGTATEPDADAEAGIDADPDADADPGFVCECSGGNEITGVGTWVVPDSGSGRCGQPMCEDDCGHQWMAVCVTSGAFSCREGAPTCHDAAPE